MGLTTSRIYTVEADQQPGPVEDEDHEDPDIVDVLVSSQDFGHLDASEQFSMTSEDYHVLLADLEKTNLYFD